MISSRKKAKKIEVRNMKRFNQHHFNEELLAQPWEQIVTYNQTQTLCGLFGNIFFLRS
jgi:hypothetical protein